MSSTCTFIVCAARSTGTARSLSSKRFGESDMFSKLLRPSRNTAAWRVAIWTTLAFALGSAVAFGITYYVVANSVRERSDAWLSGEPQVVGQVSNSTPQDALDARIEGE